MPCPSLVLPSLIFFGGTFFRGTVLPGVSPLSTGRPCQRPPLQNRRCPGAGAPPPQLIVAPKPPRWAGSPRRGDSYSRYEVAAAAAGGVAPLVQEAVRPEGVRRCRLNPETCKYGQVPPNVQQAPFVSRPPPKPPNTFLEVLPVFFGLNFCRSKSTKM